MAGADEVGELALRPKVQPLVRCTGVPAGQLPLLAAIELWVDLVDGGKKIGLRAPVVIVVHTPTIASACPSLHVQIFGSPWDPLLP